MWYCLMVLGRCLTITRVNKQPTRWQSLVVPRQPCCFPLSILKEGRGASLVAQTVQNLPAIQETWIQSLDREHPVKKGMATHSSILAWRIPWTKKSGGLQFMGSQRVRHNWMNYHRHIHSKNYMRYSTLHYKIGSALDDFAQLQAHVHIYSGWSLAMQFWVG